MHLMTIHTMGVTRACGLIGISRSLYRYELKRPDDGELLARLTALAGQKRRYGYRRLHVLLRREGWQLNWKRTYRVYHAAGLMVRRRKRKRIASVERTIKVLATWPNQSWSMDFVSDGFIDGRRLRCLNIVDDFTRECLAIEVDTSLPGRRVIEVLERLAESRGLPRSVTVDNVLNARGFVQKERASSSSEK
jgi:putative transposase